MGALCNFESDMLPVRMVDESGGGERDEVCEGVRETCEESNVDSMNLEQEVDQGKKHESEAVGSEESDGEYEDAEENELEVRIEQLESSFERRELSNVQFMKAMRDCVDVRDREISRYKEEVQNKNETIKKLSEKINCSEEKINNLIEVVSALEKKLNIPPNSDQENESTEKTKTNRTANHDERKKKKKTYTPLNLNENFKTESFTKYFLISMQTGVKRTLCPFEFERMLSDKLGGPPESISGSGRDGFLVSVYSKVQSERIINIGEVCGTQCTVMEDKFFNECKGLIYVYGYEINDLESFKEGLAEEYNVTEVIRATWIKTRSEGTQCFLVTFKEEVLPKFVNIPGEAQLTQIYEYKDRPMQCAKCLKYGHTAKRCSNDFPICAKCASVGHQAKDCTSEHLMCHNCGGNHRAGNFICEKRKDEEAITEIQKRCKVGRRMAGQMYRGEVAAEAGEEEQYERFLDLTMKPEEKRMQCPYKLKKILQNDYQVKETNIKGIRGGFTIKTENAEQSEKLMSMKKIAEIECKVSDHKIFNSTRGLIYINEYNINDISKFSTSMKLKYNTTEVIKANWIKTRNENTTPLLLTFSRTSLPESIKIPGEQTMTQVYPYRQRPMFCSKCLQYNHTSKYCNMQHDRCKRCATEGHSGSNCKNIPVCYHCKGNHQAGDRTCVKQIEEQEILNIQMKERVGRRYASQIYFERFPDRKTSYATATTQNRTIPDKEVTERKRGRGDSEGDEVSNPKRRVNQELDTEEVMEEEDTDEKNSKIRRQAEEILTVLTGEETSTQNSNRDLKRGEAEEEQVKDKLRIPHNTKKKAKERRNPQVINIQRSNQNITNRNEEMGNMIQIQKPKTLTTQKRTIEPNTKPQNRSRSPNKHKPRSPCKTKKSEVKPNDRSR